MNDGKRNVASIPTAVSLTDMDMDIDDDVDNDDNFIVEIFNAIMSAIENNINSDLVSIINSNEEIIIDDFSSGEYLINGETQSLLLNASRLSNVSVNSIQILIDKFEDLDIDFEDENEYTPIFYAAANNRYDIVNLLIDNRADIYHMLNDGTSLLDISQGTVLHLIENTFSKRNDLIEFVDNLSSWDADYLLEFIDDKPYVAEIIIFEDSNIIYALLNAIKISSINIRIIDSLIYYGADINIIEPNTGNTPLYYAIVNRREDLVRLLIGSNVDISHGIRNGFYLILARNSTSEILDLIREAVISLLN